MDTREREGKGKGKWGRGRGEGGGGRQSRKANCLGGRTEALKQGKTLKKKKNRNLGGLRFLKIWKQGERVVLARIGLEVCPRPVTRYIAITRPTAPVP
jgi:hypothetical protein